jgi:hypothetical protein
VIARFRSFCSEPSQSSYLYLSEDREPASHEMMLDFRLPKRYYRVPSSYFLSLYQAPQKSQKKLDTFHYPIALRATILVLCCFVEFVSIVVKSCWCFGFVFSICSTPLHAFGYAARLIPPLQQQIDPLDSSICPARHLVLLLRFASPR